MVLRIINNLFRLRGWSTFSPAGGSTTDEPRKTAKCAKPGPERRGESVKREKPEAQGDALKTIKIIFYGENKNG